MKNVHVLGIQISSLKKKELLDAVSHFLNSSRQHSIFTPNPEMLVQAQTDTLFKNILNSSSLNICDGGGIELLSRGKVKQTTGIDFLHDISELATQKRKRVFLLGCGNQAILEKTKAILLKKYPSLLIAGIHPGVQLEQNKNTGALSIENQEEHAAMIEFIKQSAPDILFVAFGHGKQEKWIYQFLHYIPSVRIAMGVGGAFNMIAGNVRRAPLPLRLIKLEWLWRLFQQPWRIKRIWRAVVLFPWYYYRHQDSKK